MTTKETAMRKLSFKNIDADSITAAKKGCTNIASKSPSLSNEFVLNVLDHMTVGG